MRSNEVYFTCTRVAFKFFTKIQLFTRRLGIENGVILVKIHEGKIASFNVTLGNVTLGNVTVGSTSPTKKSSWPEVNISGYLLYLFTQRMSRLLKFCNIQFGGLEVNISKGSISDAKFYTLIRTKELEALSNFFCPLIKEKPMHRICSKIETKDGGICQARPLLRSERTLGGIQARGTHAEKLACQ